MGEYAEDRLRWEMNRGSPMPTGKPRRRKLVTCPICGKQFRGSAGVMEHANAKHGAKYSRMDINCQVPEYDDV